MLEKNAELLEQLQTMDLQNAEQLDKELAELDKMFRQLNDCLQAESLPVPPADSGHGKPFAANQHDGKAQPQKAAARGGAKRQVPRGQSVLVVPDGTKTIRNGQYRGKRYERAFVPKSVTVILDCAFANCESLKEVVIEEGSGLKTIGREVFRGCSSLASISFPEGLESIGAYAFEGTGLENAEFPGSLRTIGQGAFYGCKRLRAAKFTDGLEVLGTNEHRGDKTYHGVFQESSLERIDLPRTLRRIEARTFEGCSKLRSITLPDSLERIETRCFRKSGLTEIQVPNAGVCADKSAFGGCHAKGSLVFRGGRVFRKDRVLREDSACDDEIFRGEDIR